MSEITIQRQGELVRKLFEILIAHPDGIKAQEALSDLRNQMQLTEHEKGEYQSGGPRFEKIVRFATIDYVKAGWMIKEKGRWIITDLGKDAWNKYKSPEIFHRNAVKLYREWKANRPDSKPEDIETAEGGDEKEATVTFEQARDQAWDEIEEYLTEMPPYDFQQLVASLLKAMGYHVSWVAPPGKDGGIDILAWNDPLGTRPPRIKVQVKRKNEAVRLPDLRSFLAVLGDEDVGIFVSTGGFTRDSEEEARAQPNRQVTLIDLGRLYELWIEHIKDLDQEARDLFPLKPIYFLAPDN